MDKLIEDSAHRIFSDLNGDTSSLWGALEENGLTKIWIPEDLGGSGLSVEQGFGLIRMSGSFDASIPFTETLMAGFILSTVGLETPDGRLTIAGKTEDVAFGNEVDFIVDVSSDNKINLYKASPGDEVNCLGVDPITRTDYSSQTPIESRPCVDGFGTEQINQFCALARAAQMCGAMEKVLDITLEYTSQREQFGRPLTKFQAIQHLLSEMAAETAASSALVDAAAETISIQARPDLRAIACAKMRSSEAAGIVAAHAHQAHGAIGFTQEYHLARFTRRLWQWREDFGNETYWAMVLGNDYMSSSSRGLIEEILGASNE